MSIRDSKGVTDLEALAAEVERERAEKGHTPFDGDASEHADTSESVTDVVEDVPSTTGFGAVRHV